MSAAPGAALLGPALLLSFPPPHVLDTGVLQTAARSRRQLPFLWHPAKANFSLVHESAYHYLVPGCYMKKYRVGVETVELRKKDTYGVL